MKKTSKRTLTPKLRFPEFRDKGEWEVKKLADIVTSISNGISLNQGAATSGVKVTRIETISESRIDLSKVGYIETDEDISAHKLAVGDILLSNINSVAHIGKSVIIERDYDLFHGMNLLRLVIDSQRVVPRFAFLSLNTDEARASIRARANKAVNQASINQTELGRTLVVIPHPPEQQKIAECLSSLDGLIIAEDRKLEALKAHKKGLLQQLFPQPGQTQPRLRFPEFRDKGEWISDSLGEIFETSSGGTPERSMKKYWNGKIPWISTSLVDSNVIYKADEFISELGLKNSSAKLFPRGTVLVAMYGQGKTRGKVALLDIEATTNQACAAIIPREEIYPYFVFLNLAGRYDEMRGLSNSGGQENLSQGLIKELQFSYPNDINEQRTIADCLSSLDTQISAQAAEIESLKQHKRGLMQQLFPSPEEQ